MQSQHEYPKYKYHPVEDACVVDSEESELELGDGWFDSPAEYGVETCPGMKPDPKILSKKSKPAPKAEKKVKPGVDE